MENNQKKPHRLVALLLDNSWYVHPLAVVVIRGTPALCLQTLALAAKPSTDRLHLGNLFASGRRYEIQLRDSGFALMTTSKIPWYYRRRTTPAAVMLAKFSRLDENMTHIQMRVRIRLLYLLDVFLIPTFMTSIVIFMPWNPLFIILPVVALYGLSWFGHRFNAALEANEMIFFVQKALEDLVPTDLAALNATTGDVTYEQQAFSEAWEKFYQAHKEDR